VSVSEHVSQIIINKTMNTRKTIRNRSEREMDINSDEERDRERDDFERQRERDKERDKERETDFGRERDVMSRRVTGAESQTQPRGVGGSKKTLHDGTFGGTPPKRLHSEAASSHTYTATGARPKEPVARYR